MLTKKVKKRVSFLSLLLISLVLAVFFILKSLTSNILYFKSPTDIQLSQDILPKKKIRVGGMVKKDSINIPIIKYSVDWWNTLHQTKSINFIDRTSDIHLSMLLPLMLMLLVLLLYCALILLMKYKTEIIRIKKKNIKRI